MEIYDPGLVSVNPKKFTQLSFTSKNLKEMSKQIEKIAKEMEKTGIKELKKNELLEMLGLKQEENKPTKPQLLRLLPQEMKEEIIDYFPFKELPIENSTPTKDFNQYFQRRKDQKKKDDMKNVKDVIQFVENVMSGFDEQDDNSGEWSYEKGYNIFYLNHETETTDLDRNLSDFLIPIFETLEHEHFYEKNIHDINVKIFIDDNEEEEISFVRIVIKPEKNGEDMYKEVVRHFKKKI